MTNYQRRTETVCNGIISVHELLCVLVQRKSAEQIRIRVLVTLGKDPYCTVLIEAD